VKPAFILRRRSFVGRPEGRSEDTAIAAPHFHPFLWLAELFGGADRRAIAGKAARHVQGQVSGGIEKVNVVILHGDLPDKNAAAISFLPARLVQRKIGSQSHNSYCLRPTVSGVFVMNALQYRLSEKTAEIPGS
jgi:hypothetical protein